jgi:hypothetical protein
MTIDEIFAEWEVDSTISPVDLDRASLEIPKLHNKYYRMLSAERMRLRKAEADFAVLKKVKSDYYAGTLDVETMRERGYAPFRLKVLRADISNYLDADEELIQHGLKMSVMKEKVEILDSIIRTVGNRSFHVSNAIAFIRFKAGDTGR